jgi:hypothetical protein
VAAWAAATGCAPSTHVLVGQARPPTTPDQVRLYSHPLGAIGVILEGFSDAETGSIGSGVGSDSYGNHSAVGVGIGGSLGIYKKTGHGEAIYMAQPVSQDERAQ